MCKILFLKGTNTKRAAEYLDAFLQAASCDANLKTIAREFGIPGVGNCHNHGWGFLLVTKDIINTYLSGKYFFADVRGVKNLKEELSSITGEFVLMTEARVTDLGYVSALNAHPFTFSSRNGFEGWLFYNGLLDYAKLAELEEIDYSHYRTKNGTTIMGISIAKALEAGKTIQEALVEPKKTLKSAYNLMLFLHDNTGKYKAFLHSFISKDLFEKDYVKNHNTIIYADEGDIFFAGNASIGKEISGDFQAMENGQTFEFSIDFIEEYYFDGYEK